MPVPEHGQLAHGRDERQQHVPVGVGREPVRRAAAGNQLQQRDDRAPAADAPVPRVRRHQHDEQRRQVVVQLRPVRPAEAVLAGLHARRLLHLVEVDAGDRVPERDRREADQDDLGPGRDAPAVDQRHLRAAVRAGQAVPVGRERRDGAWSAAGRSRASTRTRPASPSRSGPTASTTAPIRSMARTSRSTRRARPSGSTPTSSRRSSTARRPTRRRSTTCGRSRLRFDDVRRDAINNVDLSLLKSVGSPSGMRARS